jgi:hypothetical protein
MTLAQLYRERAARVRRLAELTRYPIVRRQLAVIATEYDEMAEAAEREQAMRELEKAC